MGVGWGWRKGVSQEEGHATEVIQLKVYRPLRPLISASVNEKFCHNVNDWDPTQGIFTVQSKPINPRGTKTSTISIKSCDNFINIIMEDCSVSFTVRWRMSDEYPVLEMSKLKKIAWNTVNRYYNIIIVIIFLHRQSIMCFCLRYI